MRTKSVLHLIAGLLMTPAVLLAQRPANPPASPRDTARATMAGATILIDYGRPFKRGRTIFDSLVPYDKVWRTGANAATTLVTDKPLMLGSLMMPAGKYTLYTLPTAAGWKLIVNKQTGQWGTEYDPSQDLGRADMKVETLTTPVEQFTITIEPSGDMGVLRLAWDRTAATIPIMVH